MAVVIGRPPWFLDLVRKLYRGKQFALAADGLASRGSAFDSTLTRIKTLLALVAFMLVDIVPLPVTGGFGTYVVLTRPAWFLALVEKIYGGQAGVTGGTGIKE
jgi:hypothetical protein